MFIGVVWFINGVQIVGGSRHGMPI